MILLHCALHCEAKKLIEHYNLKLLREIDRFNVFFSDTHLLVIGGIGTINTAIAISFISAKFPKISHYFNVGICGATPKTKIGEIVVPYKIIDLTSNKTFYPEPLIKHSYIEGVLGTALRPVNEAQDGMDFYDMEGSAFFEAALKFQDTSRVYSVKIVSDNLDINEKINSEKIDKATVDTLFKTNLTKITDFIDSIVSMTDAESVDKNLLDDKEISTLTDFFIDKRFTVTQRNLLIEKAKGFKVRGGDILDAIKDNSLIINKMDRNDLFREVEKTLST